MTAADARKIIVDMEVSADTMLKAEAMLEKYGENEEIPEELINQILKVVDADFDPAKVVEDMIN
jgi:hypothetical protein